MYMHHLCLESHCDINVILVDGKRSSQCDRHQPSQSLISHLMIVDGKMVGSHRSIMYTEKKIKRDGRRAAVEGRAKGHHVELRHLYLS